MPCFNISGGRAIDGGMSRLRARSDICRTKQFRTDALFVLPAAKIAARINGRLNGKNVFFSCRFSSLC